MIANSLASAAKMGLLHSALSSEYVSAFRVQKRLPSCHHHDHPDPCQPAISRREGLPANLRSCLRPPVWLHQGLQVEKRGVASGYNILRY